MEDSNKDTIPWNSRIVQVVLLCTTLAPLGVPLISPALPAIRDHFNITDFQASLLISSYFVIGIILSPFIGAIIDRIGRKVVLISSLFVFSMSGSIIFFTQHYTMILLLRVLQGTSAAGLFITTATLIGDTFDGIQRSAIFGMNNAALSLGAATFPIIGGILVQYHWKVPFLVYLLGLPLAVFALKVLEEPMKDATRKSQKSYISNTLKMIKKREMILPYSSSILTEVLLFGAIFTLLPFILIEKFGGSSVYVGSILSITSLV
ncbi:MAG: MFS transporter, partial [Candidatus Korarchaeota archaeon]|nr:MFS transporter [Candidatus Korarchaeota archaeon]NIU85720.1 MFS transporter [Candidatus Thorarchaeota archaeon]NIW15812.1 MFS transporter [Candidatus Thorarchaeota archaeon]